MRLADRVLSGLKTVVLIEERVTNLTQTVKDLKSYSEQKLSNHESRLTRLETIIDLTRAEIPTLRLPPR